MLFAQPAAARDSKIAIKAPVFDAYLAQLVDGEGWRSTITIVNLTETGADFTLSFYGKNGLPLEIPVVGSGAVSSIRGSLWVNSSMTIKTSGMCRPICEGWAHLSSQGVFGGQAILQWSAPGSAIRHQSSVPFMDNLDGIQLLPFDHERGTKTGLAVVNTSHDSQMEILLIFHMENGDQFWIDSFQLKPREHTAFFLDERYPVTIHYRGMVLVKTDQPGMILLGLSMETDGIPTTLFPLSSPLW